MEKEIGKLKLRGESLDSDFECDRSNMMGEIRYIKTSEADIELFCKSHTLFE